MWKKSKTSGREVARSGGRRGATVGIVTAAAVAGVVAGAVLTKLLLRARAARRWDQQVERFRAQGAL
jgi:membrane associated rhomboid family serine protease